ncbi:hypothetical protein TIFTF001_051703 [Ficus carica]|uniref:Uncharacterized protein n=1 Tax=Ficus carica TaxID=3494 RepID=A0AA87ZAD0_FICCA|nr:hypothetical protein TIFTF001_051703 [Ficus carica]
MEELLRRGKSFSIQVLGRESESRTISSLAQSVVGPKESSSSIDVAGYRHGRKIGTSPTARAWLIASLNRMESLEAGTQTESETRDTLMASDRLARIEMIVSGRDQARGIPFYTCL